MAGSKGGALLLSLLALCLAPAFVPSAPRAAPAALSAAVAAAPLAANAAAAWASGGRSEMGGGCWVGDPNGFTVFLEDVGGGGRG